MSQNAHPSVVNALAEAFGPNAGLALELYAGYRLNPASVEEGWRRAFEAAESAAALRTDPRRAFTATVSAAPAAEGPASGGTPEPPAAQPRSVPAGAVPPPDGEIVPLAGGAAAVARNMDASLAVPTATSNRLIAAKTMRRTGGS